MSRRVFFSLAIFAFIQVSLAILLSPPSLAQEWTVRGKQQGTLKVVDLYVPGTSAVESYAEGLLTVDKDNNFIPSLAEDWRWINDRTIEFRLREAVKFHNGERFNAAAVKVNWEAYRKMESPPFFRFLALPDETKFEIIDEYMVRFTFPEPDGLALVRFRHFYQLAPAFFEKHKFYERSWGFLAEAGPWGTGPFKVVEGSFPVGRISDRVVLEAFERYWDRRYPKVKRVIFDNALIGNRKEAMRLCREEEGAVDIVSHIRPLDTLKVATSPFAKVVKSRDVNILWGKFNQRKRNSKWRDVRLRRAINYAINRKELWKYAARGNAYNLEGFPIPTGEYGHNPNLTPYTYDTTKARSLLAEAGYPQGFEVEVLTQERLKLEAQIIKRMLERIGLKVTLDVLTFYEQMKKTYVPLMDKPYEETHWDIGFWRPLDWAGHTAASILVFETDRSDWRMIEYDAVYEKLWKNMARTVDRNAQEEKIRQMVQHNYERAHSLFIYSPLSLYAVNKQVNFVPQKCGYMRLKETSVTDNHWSVRGEKK